MPEPHLRAADSDREAMAAVLGKHMAAGRLTLAEYDERVARAYAARTYGDLDALTADLPPLSAAAPESASPATTPRPAATVPSPVPGPPVQRRSNPWGWHDRDNGWRSWAATSVIVLVIYIATSLSSGELVYFWPIWVIGPWGGVLLAQRITRGGSRDEDTRPPLDR
jgi:hypothetical protein